MDLESYLVHHEIDEVYIAGFNTDCCVLATALEMFDNGIHPIIVEDLCGSTEGEEYHNSALMLLCKILGNDNVVTSEKLFETR